jgi:hypothetical protein
VTPDAAAQLDVPRGNAIEGDPRSRGAARVGEAAHPAITSRNGGLDAVRLGAAALVFVSHAALASGVSPSAAIINSGVVGVAIFFVLSGYLIPTVWAGRPDRTYWLRRAARIFPAYWFALIGLGLLLGVSIGIPELTMTQPIDGTQFETFLGVAWTLRVELVFYALVPLIARLPTWWLVAVSACSFAAMVGVTDPLWLDSPPVRFWQFLPGILVARGLVRGNAVRRGGGARGIDLRKRLAPDPPARRARSRPRRRRRGPAADPRARVGRVRLDHQLRDLPVAPRDPAIASRPRPAAGGDRRRRDRPHGCGRRVVVASARAASKRRGRAMAVRTR